MRGSPPSASSPGSCPEAQAAGEQGWCLPDSQGPQQKGGRRSAGTQSKIHSDRRPGLQVSQGTKEAAGPAGGHARPAPSGTHFLCEPQGGAVTKGSGRGDQWNPMGYI